MFILRYLLTEIIGKIIAAFTEYIRERERKKVESELQEQVLKKHGELIKKANDDELSKSFEDVLNNVKRK